MSINTGTKSEQIFEEKTQHAVFERKDICVLSTMRSIGLLWILFFVLFWEISDGTPLDDYVNMPDPAFSWTRLQTYPQPTYTLYVLNMTSQQWFDGEI